MKKGETPSLSGFCRLRGKSDRAQESESKKRQYRSKRDNNECTQGGCHEKVIDGLTRCAKHRLKHRGNWKVVEAPSLELFSKEKT